MTREQALEVALRNMKILFDGMGGENRDMSSTVEFKCAELSPIYQQARAALALPPDGVNADMLAALETLADAYSEAILYVPQYFREKWRLDDELDNARAAIAKATS